MSETDKVQFVSHSFIIHCS